MRVHRCSSECANLSLSGLLCSAGELPELQSQRSSGFLNTILANVEFLVNMKLLQKIIGFITQTGLFPGSTAVDMDMEPRWGTDV